MLGKLKAPDCFICISFGVLMWETLARKLPWSWLTCTIKQAICHHQLTLPMLEIWPDYIRSIMTECLQDPEDRPCFRTLHETLLAIRNSGEGLTSEVLDEAFPDWFDTQDGNVLIETRRRRKRSLELRHHSSTCRTSEICLMLRHSSYQGNKRHGSSSLRERLRDILKAFSRKTQNYPHEQEIERFGYEIAERLAVVRNILGVSRNYKRARWAREVVLTRVLEGDIERVITDEKAATSTKKSKKSNKSSRRGRRYSDFHQETFKSLLVTSSKYQRKDWSKVVHGKEKLKNSIEGFKGKVNEELSECRRKLLTDHSIPNASQDSLALLLLWENNRATLKSNTNVAGNKNEQQSRIKAVDEEFKETFQQSTNSRKDPVKLKGGEQPAEAINDADSSSSNDRSERLRTRSLGPTEPRARSARHIRIDSAQALSARRGKSDASAVLSDTEKNSLESKTPIDEDVGNGRVHRFSIRPDMTQGKRLSSTPLKELSFSSNEDWKDVVKRNSADIGERVSSVLLNDWCHLRN